MKTSSLRLTSIVALLIFISCNEDQANNNSLPEVSTFVVEEITQTSAISGGNISLAGESAVTERGVCYSTSPNPTKTSNFTIDGSGTGSFSSSLTGLSPNTTYYVRAYATNSSGTKYGNERSFTTATSGGSGIVSMPGPGVTFDGYHYQTVILGNGQEWMAENLRSSHYRNGDTIIHGMESWFWVNYKQSLEMWVHYNNDSQNENIYGKLYNSRAANYYKPECDICPTGWHLPTLEEFILLAEYLSDGPLTVNNNNVGGKLKSTGTQLWNTPNGTNIGATNESGFNGHPGGYRGFTGDYGGINSMGLWWTSTSIYMGGEDQYYSFSLHSQNSAFELTYYPSGTGHSVRCLKD